MMEMFLSYLSLLDALREKLATLCDLAAQKTAAVRNDDLMALNNVMKQEQALALAFRGLEQKKSTQAKALGVEDVLLSKLPEQYPEELQLRARKTVEALQDQFKIYQASSEVARNTLECNLHEIEKFLAAQEALPTTGPGYTAAPVEPPRTMKSDFRA